MNGLQHNSLLPHKVHVGVSSNHNYLTDSYSTTKCFPVCMCMHCYIILSEAGSSLYCMQSLDVWFELYKTMWPIVCITVQGASIGSVLSSRSNYLLTDNNQSCIKLHYSKLLYTFRLRNTLS